MPRYRANAVGIARTFQTVRLLESMTVLANVMIGAATRAVQRGAARRTGCVVTRARADNRRGSRHRRARARASRHDRVRRRIPAGSALRPPAPCRDRARARERAPAAAARRANRRDEPRRAGRGRRSADRAEPRRSHAGARRARPRDDPPGLQSHVCAELRQGDRRRNPDPRCSPTPRRCARRISATAPSARSPPSPRRSRSDERVRGAGPRHRGTRGPLRPRHRGLGSVARASQGRGGHRARRQRRRQELDAPRAVGSDQGVGDRRRLGCSASASWAGPPTAWSAAGWCSCPRAGRWSRR